MSTPITLDDIWALFRETDRQFQETSAEIRATEFLIKEVGQQLNRLGDKFGGFAERLALPSMQKILQQRFGVDTVSPSVRLKRDGQHLEIDVLAYANGDINAAYVVEVKSHLREKDIEQLLKNHWIEKPATETDSDYSRSGFTWRRPLNRLKSLSVEYSV